MHEPFVVVQWPPLSGYTIPPCLFPAGLPGSDPVLDTIYQLKTEDRTDRDLCCGMLLLLLLLWYVVVVVVDVRMLLLLSPLLLLLFLLFM